MKRSNWSNLWLNVWVCKFWYPNQRKKYQSEVKDKVLKDSCKYTCKCNLPSEKYLSKQNNKSNKHWKWALNRITAPKTATYRRYNALGCMGKKRHAVSKIFLTKFFPCCALLEPPAVSVKLLHVYWKNIFFAYFDTWWLSWCLQPCVGFWKQSRLNTFFSCSNKQYNFKS